MRFLKSAIGSARLELLVDIDDGDDEITGGRGDAAGLEDELGAVILGVWKTGRVLAATTTSTTVEIQNKIFLTLFTI